MILGAILIVCAIIAEIIILGFMLCIALVKYGETNDIGAATAFGEIFRNFKANLINYIIGFIILEVLFFVIFILAVIAMITIIGFIFLGMIYFYYYMVTMRMFAQIYKESKEKLDVKF